MAQNQDEIQKTRHSNYPIQPLILNRWSPRSMLKNAEMTDEELFPLFEAARWAPSSYNSQPWRFFYAKRNSPEWDLFFQLLVPANQAWCSNASVLVVVVSRNTFEKNNQLSVTHSYDTGAAWMALALEGTSRGYVVHGMSGFNYEKARESLKIPEGYTVEAMAAIGKRAPKEDLPTELQKMESPNTRRPLDEIIFQGPFSE